MAVPRPEPRGYPGNLGTPFIAHSGSTRNALIDLRDPGSEREHSYAALDAQANAVARGLVRRGLKTGDDVQLTFTEAVAVAVEPANPAR